MKGKSINSLMIHIRNNHQLTIQGSIDKKKLTEMGYFHGYKAYRFLRTPSNKLNLTNFSQITAIYDFDMQLKQIFYPSIMKLETLLKNVVLNEVVVDNTSFDDVFRNQLTHFRELRPGSANYRKEMKKRLQLKSKLEQEISINYSRSYVQHYINSERFLPIWAYFELMMMGEFGTFVSLLNTEKKLNIAKELKTIDYAFDTDGSLLAKHIFILKELRNAVAHNNVIFDSRFKKSEIDSNVGDQLKREFNIPVSLNFNTVTDYSILIAHYFHNFGQNKSETKRSLRTFLDSAERLKAEINDNSIIFRILGSDYKIKLTAVINSL